MASTGTLVARLALLAAAHSLLQERAGRIDDEALRRSYLENVAANREIAAGFSRVHELDASGS